MEGRVMGPILMMFASQSRAEAAGFRTDLETGRFVLKPWDTREVEAWWPGVGVHAFPGRRYGLVLVTHDLHRDAYYDARKQRLVDEVMREQMPACLLPEGRVVQL